MSLTLAILAAGLGRRFGGDKQLAAVGPSGETLLDYTLYDAGQAGFEHVMCIVRPELEDLCRAALEPRWRGRFDFAYAHQRIDDLPDGFAAPADRSRPWGTGHAVLSLAEKIDTPFVVVNADDFYGPQAFLLLAQTLRQPQRSDRPRYGLVTYQLINTIPAQGQVNRAICQLNADKTLADITEVVGIERDGDNGRSASHGEIPGATPVSMNIWGFTPQIFEPLSASFATFLQQPDVMAAGEFYLPAAVNDWVQRDEAVVQTLPSPDTWCGLTHPEDRNTVAAFLNDHIARGYYPSTL